MRTAARWLRRHLPLIMLVAALVWIGMIIVLITINPVAGTGNPMD
ncbi:MAG TPA: hypothetical protein VFR67_22050 [Pilimelia sp.]|nr:hypothetical protein [Pilimelia sp.]